MVASEIAKKVAGTWIEAETPPPALGWLSDECRTGKLAKHVLAFAEAQKEPLDTSLTVVDKVLETHLLCRIPAKIADHESTSTFRVDVSFNLDPTTGKCERIN